MSSEEASAQVGLSLVLWNKEKSAKWHFKSQLKENWHFVLKYWLKYFHQALNWTVVFIAHPRRRLSSTKPPPCTRKQRTNVMGTAGAAEHSVMLTGIIALNFPSWPFPIGPQLSCRVNLKPPCGASWVLLTCWEPFHICLCLFCTLQHWHSHLWLFSCLAPLLPGVKYTRRAGWLSDSPLCHTLLAGKIEPFPYRKVNPL